MDASDAGSLRGKPYIKTFIPGEVYAEARQPLQGPLNQQNAKLKKLVGDDLSLPEKLNNTILLSRRAAMTARGVASHVYELKEGSTWKRRDVILQDVTTKKRICCKLWGRHAESVAGFSEGSTVEVTKYRLCHDRVWKYIYVYVHTYDMSPDVLSNVMPVKCHLTLEGDDVKELQLK
ncbi:hypothetical protein BSL78_22461 [Apostichopus japonicus]|uniref:Uncharacterized protein n=1 Tax=Stichopus japonicus TaxID=307972 RepID=A0A2G8JY61_STIJA|nr:hypothetical protein BSL78_22461 [Apostichopus japonicus]